MNPEEFSEIQLFSDAAKTKRKVDASGLVKEVHIMGFGGTNVKKGKKKPYKYSAKAFQDAVNKGLYENISLQIGHTDDDKDSISSRNNDPTKKIGFTKNTRFKDGEGVVGDLQLNTEHPSFASHKWWIENGPEHIALSNEALCKYNDSTDQIDEIAKVLFIALVGEGNTTNGIFKDGAIGDSLTEEDEATKVYRIIDHFNRLCSRILYPLEKSFTSSEKALQLLPIAQDLVKTLKGFDSVSKDSAKINEEIKKEDNMEFDKLTLEDLKTKRKDLVDLIAKDALTQEDTLNAKVEAALKDIPSDKRGKAFVVLIKDSIRSGKDVAELVTEQVALCKDAAEAAKHKVEKPISKKKIEVVEEESKEIVKDSKVLDDAAILAAFKH